MAATIDQGLRWWAARKSQPMVSWSVRAMDRADRAGFARADFGKTAIVVNDSLGFITSRTFGTCLDEGARLLKGEVTCSPFSGS